ncbi:hypothetical protein AMECASPLE_023468 [Ameca splendens]|uniref:Uncharacterized protein n=1 Tax=Ameca splendens TaxID=208324 RepID=A0ABV0YFH6_9TELE
MDPLFCLSGSSSPHVALSAAVITLDEMLELAVSSSLCSPFVSVFAPAFNCPEFHSGSALQMQDDQMIPVWLLMLGKPFFLSEPFTASANLLVLFGRHVRIYICFHVSAFLVHIYSLTGNLWTVKT